MKKERKEGVKERIVGESYIGTAYEKTPSGICARKAVFEKFTGLRFDPKQVSSHRVYGEFYLLGKTWKGYIRKKNSPQAYELSIEVMRRNGGQ